MLEETSAFSFVWWVREVYRLGGETALTSSALLTKDPRRLELRVIERRQGPTRLRSLAAVPGAGAEDHLRRVDLHRNGYKRDLEDEEEGRTRWLLVDAWTPAALSSLRAFVAASFPSPRILSALSLSLSLSQRRPQAQTPPPLLAVTA